MKTYKYFSIIAAALAMGACSNDDLVGDNNGGQAGGEGKPVEFTSVITSELDALPEENLDGGIVGSATRSTLENGKFTGWNKGDKVSVSDGTLMFNYKVTSTNDASCTFEVSEGGNEFTGDGAADKTFYCAYPADAVKGWNGSTVTEMVYAEQKYDENIDGGAMGAYMVTSAQADETGNAVSFSFAHSASVIEVNLATLGVQPKAVYLKSNSGVAIAGEVKCDVTDKSMTVSTTGGTAYCTSSQSDVIALTNVASDATIARFYILPVKLVGGVTVTVVDTDGNYYTKKTSTDIGNAADFTVTNNINSVLSGWNTKTTTTAAKPYYKKVNFGTATSATRKGNWMATIPSNIYFNMLSTPGAHDACTQGQAVGLVSECQDLTLQELLEAGVRCFDIRPGYKLNTAITSDNLYIWHGTTKTDTKYVDAISTFCTFLQNNPTEAISIVMTKEASSGTDRSDEMWDVLRACHNDNANKDYFKVMDHSNYNLGDYRGKIFYVNRTGTTDIPGTVNIKYIDENDNNIEKAGWPDNGTLSNWKGIIGLCNANVQDVYKSNGQAKQKAVEDMLQITSASIDVKKVITYNYTSSSNFPSTYANSTNPAISTYLNDDNISGPTSYLLCDYIGCTKNSGDVLLKAIVNQNYKYVFLGRTRNVAAPGAGIGVGIAGDEYADGGTVYAPKR